MSISRQEEIIGVLWIIASLLAFGFGHPIFGGMCAGKAIFDFLCSILSAVLEKLQWGKK